MLRKDRLGRKGGGVILYVRSELGVRGREDLDSVNCRSIEHSGCEIGGAAGRTVVVKFVIGRRTHPVRMMQRFFVLVQNTWISLRRYYFSETSTCLI